MKKIVLRKFNRLVMTVALSTVALSSCLEASALNPTEAEKRRCFIDNPDEKTITFLYCVDDGFWPTKPTSDSYVCGSFNGWSKNEDFKLAYDEESNCYYVTVPYSKLTVPGNSGQPEYKFVIDGDQWQNNYDKDFLDKDYVFQTSDKNLIVVYSTDDFETIKQNSQLAGTIRKLSDFDLTNPEDQATIANFRLVPGTTKLFRSYHPFKASRSEAEERYKDIDTENARITWVDSLASQAGIQSDICLSGDETGTLTSYVSGDNTTYTETIPAYYQSIIDNGNVLYVGATTKIPSYGGVYARSNNDVFAGWIKEIVEFVNSHPSPYQIHCRLGTDRTGVIGGVMAALCGASWSEIAQDYQKSNNMQIQEFRDYKLLAYSFKNMLGDVDLETADLQDLFFNYFTTATSTITNVVTVNQLKTFVNRLGGDITGIAAVKVANQKDNSWYNIQGVKVNQPQKGHLYIHNGKKVIL